MLQADRKVALRRRLPGMNPLVNCYTPGACLVLQNAPHPRSSTFLQAALECCSCLQGSARSAAQQAVLLSRLCATLSPLAGGKALMPQLHVTALAAGCDMCQSHQPPVQMLVL